MRLPVLSPPPRTWPAPLATGCAAGFAYNSTTLACDVCGAGNYCAGSGSTLTSAVRTVCGVGPGGGGGGSAQHWHKLALNLPSLASERERAFS